MSGLLILKRLQRYLFILFRDSNDFIPEKHAVLFNGGNTFRVKASNKGIRFLLLSGKPLYEPIAWGGPIVMNTAEELEQAFKDMEEETFVAY